MFGAKLIAELVEQADGRIEIMAGSGVNAENVAKIVNDTEVSNIHFTSHKMEPSEMEYINEKISMGSDSKEDEQRVFDRDKIRGISVALENMKA